jgi:hypothetical protein
VGEQVVCRSETALAGWRAAAPAARSAMSVSGACDAVAADGTVQQEGMQLAAAVLRSRWAEPFDVWSAVRRAWSGVRDQGGGAPAARTAAMRAVEAVWGGARVRDVTALPEPALVAGAGFASPGQWADAEFQHRWQQYVLDCCGRLEEALGSATGDGGDGWQLVRVSGWPLTRKRDAELAYLAQYEQHGPTVPFGGRRTGYGVEPDHAVVLAVPRFAAGHSAEHTRDDRQRVILGPELVAGSAGSDERDVLALLRGAYPYLPADTEGDGPGARPTAMVTAARAVRRAAQLGRRAAYSGPDSMEVYNDLVVGKYSWVPDDEHPGPAAAEMEELPVHWLKDWMLCLDVECGVRSETVLHRLYGTVTSYEPGTGRVGFSATRPSWCPSTGSSRSPATGSGAARDRCRPDSRTMSRRLSASAARAACWVGPGDIRVRQMVNRPATWTSTGPTRSRARWSGRSCCCGPIDGPDRHRSVLTHRGAVDSPEL